MQYRLQPARRLIIFLLFIILCAGCSCSSQPAAAPQGVSQYQIKGRVESIDLDKQRVTIAHEKIEGYMDDMTMPFPVRDQTILRNLKSGDTITARLFVDHSKNMRWLEDVRVESRK